MLYFLISVVALVAGHFLYGAFVDRLFGSDPGRPTPAITEEDGIDFIPLPPAKIFLIQLLNIAGLGPIFGAILGALYGPVALLWIVLGNIFAGTVNHQDSSKAHLRGVIAMEGGYISEIVDMELVDADHLRGGTVWHWSDGVFQCGGSLTFTGRREGAPEAPEAGARAPGTPLPELPAAPEFPRSQPMPSPVEKSPS